MNRHQFKVFNSRTRNKFSWTQTKLKRTLRSNLPKCITAKKSHTFSQKSTTQKSLFKSYFIIIIDFFRKKHVTLKRIIARHDETMEEKIKRKEEFKNS